jgi:hypothetical protein
MSNQPSDVITPTWYKVNKWYERVDAVRVERSTDKCVWVNGSRRARISDYEQFFQTWAEAHAALMEIAESRVCSARRALELANGFLGNVKGMKGP